MVAPSPSLKHLCPHVEMKSASSKSWTVFCWTPPNKPGAVLLFFVSFFLSLSVSLQLCLSRMLCQSVNQWRKTETEKPRARAHVGESDLQRNREPSVRATGDPGVHTCCPSPVCTRAGPTLDASNKPDSYMRHDPGLELPPRLPLLVCIWHWCGAVRRVLQRSRCGSRQEARVIKTRRH